jgi:general secretion pathway protein C
MANRIFTIINLLLITAGMYLSVSTFYAILTARMDYGDPTVAEPVGRSFAAARYTPPPRSDYETIVTRNLFNSGTQEGVSTESQQADLQLDKLEETKMNLKLWGTVAGTDDRAYAVIEDTKTRRQSLYHPGDQVQNAIIKMVLRQKVVLTVDGRDEILAMQEPGKKSGSPATGVNRADTPSPALAPTPRLPVSASPREIAVKSEQIAEAMENIGDLMTQATFRPHIENGSPAGISITRIKPNAIFRRLRLRNGDIITGVNGSPIQSVEDAMGVFENLTNGTNIQLDIKRRGRQQTLEYRIE